VTFYFENIADNESHHQMSFTCTYALCVHHEFIV